MKPERFSLHTSWDRLLRLLFPPRCLACRTLLAPDTTDSLCPECRANLEDHRIRQCPRCFQFLNQCSCSTEYLERAGIHSLGKVFRYDPKDREETENQLIFRLKEANLSAVADCLAGELAPVVRRLADPPERYVIVGVPRSRSAIRKYGYDHIRMLCRSLSRLTGIPYIAAVRRVGGMGQQKKKNRTERMRSAAVSYAPAPHVDLRGKRVILIDDLVTSGATLAACAHAVRKCGVKTVHAAVLAVHIHYDETWGEPQ